MKLPDFLAEDKYGLIHIAGHRIALGHIVELYNEGRSVEELAEQFPTLPRDRIEQAVTFYLENREQLDARLDRDRAELERQAAAPRHGPTHAELRRRMESRGSASPGRG